MKKIILALVLTAFALALMAADEFKIGYVDSERLMRDSKDTQEAEQLFESERQIWEAQISELEDEIDRMTEEYEGRKLTMTDAGRKEAEDAINTKMDERKDLIQDIFGENGKAARKNEELLEPIMNKIQIAIKKVADEFEYSVIMDAAAGGILYAVPSLDVTDMVLDEMNAATEDEPKETQE